ncbi:MAG TPA: hypothetical protein VIF37_14340 [Methylobacter sp.]|jgi:hypothetical protein
MGISGLNGNLAVAHTAKTIFAPNILYFLVPTHYGTAIKLRKTASFRQGLPEPSGQGWQDSDHIHLFSTIAPCIALPPASLQSWIPAIPAGMTALMA